jgi:hypothetical protein
MAAGRGNPHAGLGRQWRRAMMKYNEALNEAGVLITLDGCIRRQWARGFRFPAASLS